jgi:hypothetical protein
VNVKDSKEFIWVRCMDKKTATQVKPANPPEIIFFDADGELLSRAGVTDGDSVEKAMKAALEKYAPKQVNWTEYDEKAVSESQRLVVLAFVNDKKDSEDTLKAFEDRTIAKKHDQITFVKKEFAKDSEEAKKWGATSAPTVVFINPSKEAGKQVLEKVSGKQSVNALRALLAKAFAKMEAK